MENMEVNEKASQVRIKCIIVVGTVLALAVPIEFTVMFMA